MIAMLLLSLVAPVNQERQLSPDAILKSIESREDFGHFERELVRWFGGEEQLKKGIDVKLEDLSAVWAMRMPRGANTVTVEFEPWNPQTYLLGPLSVAPKEFSLRPLKLVAIGNEGLLVGGMRFADGAACRWRYAVDGKPFGGYHDLEAYKMPPESRQSSDIQPGKTEQQPPLTSKIFGGTKHDWWVYTPANFDSTKESNLVIFQDGQWAHGYAPVYFDHLISKGDLPQTVVLFVTPGTFPDGKSDRSREYDTLNDMYVRFLLEELLPPIEGKFKITSDPMKRCVAGLSSGGICSFTAAWQRSDKFGLVMSWVGSFTDIASGDSLRERGHNYPALIRKSPKKPIRIFLQDGANDLDNVHGSWPLGNHEMARALEFSKYDYKAVWGNGFHSDKQGRAVMADALRWLFRP